MKIAIMQPYFFPYIGYFQLIGAVDAFVVYDNIKYTKKGWINRNRYLRNGAAATFTIPLGKAPDHLDVRDRVIAKEFDRDRLLHQISAAYAKAPHFPRAYELFERALLNPEPNLFDFIFASLRWICDSLAIRTPLLVSSEIPVNHSLKGTDRVLAICRQVGADTYVNPIGGTALYAREEFRDQGIALRFLKSGDVVYPQFQEAFVPWLSILDVMMFNPSPRLAAMLTDCTVI